MAIAVTLHLLAAVVWVGGMFFAHMALRPAANALLEPPQRLPLMLAVFDRFFPWVWAAVAVLLGSGYWVFILVYHGHAALYVHLMQGLGLVMMGLFTFLYVGPYRGMRAALGRGDLPAAATALARIRRIIATNLTLGLVTVALGGAGRFL